MTRLLIYVWLVACGDNIDVVPHDEFGDAWTDARCRYWLRCGLVANEAHCAEIGDYWLHPHVIAAIDAGIVRWDSRLAKRCIDELDARSCDTTSASYRTTEECWPLYMGTRHDGEPCAFGSECISRECWFESSECADACCLGYCAGDTPPQRGAVGDRCRFAPCREGFCDGNVCLPQKNVGEPCKLDDECVVGLACTGGACAVLPAHGAPCIGRCRDVADHCTWAGGGAAGSCERGAPKGTPCVTDDQCGDFYICSTRTHECQLPEVGELCGLGRGACRAPSFCDQFSRRCTESKPDGAQCQFSGECASHSCSTSTWTCTSEICI